MTTRAGSPRVAPLVLATMASQALLVVLAPTIVAIGTDLEASVAAVGQARSITAAVAIVASIALTARIDAVGLANLIRLGAAVAIVACAVVAASPTLILFLAAHALVGLALACLLSAGFAGVAAFPAQRRAWALGHVAAANALAWIVVNPIVGSIADAVSWRATQAVPAAIALAALLAAGGASSPSRLATSPPLRELLATASARRWVASELIAYGAWTALLTFVGAFFIDGLGVGEATTGWLLACGAAAFVAASMRSAWLAALVPRRRLVVWSSLVMGALLPVQLGFTSSTAVTVVMFCLIGAVAGIRTPASSGLGLAQLADHPGAIMAARTAATQAGYLVGAVVGGAVIAAAGYATLGVVLAVGMAASALVVLTVDDPVE